MHKETKIFIKVAVGIIVLFLVYGFADTRGYQAGLLQGAALTTVQKNTVQIKKRFTQPTKQIAKPKTAKAKAEALKVAAAMAAARKAAAAKAGEENKLFAGEAGVTQPLEKALETLKTTNLNPFD